MDIKTIIDEHLIVNSADDEFVFSNVVSQMYRDIVAMYDASKRKSEFAMNKIIRDADVVKKFIVEYVGCGCDDANMGKTLLFLSKLPAIAEIIEDEIEDSRSDIKGVDQIVARDNVDKYVRELFVAGYKRLYAYEDRKQIGYHLYYECEKLIDMLVLEFKKDIEHMIDPENLVYDDLYYVRRMIKNRENALSNNEIRECVDCDKNCNYCKTFPERKALSSSLAECRELLAILDKKIMDGFVPEEDLARLRNGGNGGLVKKVCMLAPEGFEHKKIGYKASPQRLSIISAQRFEKILKRRYNSEAYRKDKDIYYILYHGIDAKEIFTGDTLLDDLDELYASYVKPIESQN
ncbi:MAG: hypothetical protein IJW24_02520 [Clostridia bacterium]|nr:hypothetical protein [Clostridia bacterium]